MGWLWDTLTLPVLGGPKLVHWLARTIAEEAKREQLDEGPVRAELLELQERYDAGVVSEEAYDREEGALLERLRAIRKQKAEEGQ
jgi:hypothetical protein